MFARPKMFPIPNVYDRVCGSEVLPENYVPARAEAIASESGKCHGLLTAFLAQFPAYQCRESAVCAALALAETYTAGFVINALKRNQAVLYMAAHLLSMGEVSVSESISRVSAIASGGVAAPSMRSPVTDDWLGLSVWGAAFQGLVERNVRLGAFVC